MNWPHTIMIWIAFALIGAGSAGAVPLEWHGMRRLCFGFLCVGITLIVCDIGGVFR